MNTKSFNTLAVVSAVLLTLLGSASVRAGTITVVNLPATNTDIATGITTNKTYVCAFNFGSQNATTYSVNGVPFAHFKSAMQNVHLTTNWIDTTHGGQVIVSVAVTNKGIDVTSSTASGGNGAPTVAQQADGNMRSILTDLMYSGNGGPIGGWLQEEYDNLTIGHQYSLRAYYRNWSNPGDRTQNFFFNGEGSWQAYSGNPLDEDAGGSGGAFNGAHYIEYDFTAAATNVFCLASNLFVNGATMIYGATLEDDSVPFKPFITQQPKVVTIGSPSVFAVTAIGTPTVAYQWYSNSINSYAGAAAVTDGNDYSGSTTTNLMATNNLLDYYFVVVTNDYGSVTSSIVQIGVNPTIITQPTISANVGVSVLYSVVAGPTAGSIFPPLAYQWYSNSINSYAGAAAVTDGNDYSGSTTNTLAATNNLQDYYFVVVTNTYGSVTSSITAYNPLPIIVTQPTGFKSGNSIGLAVTATNAWPSLGYQWYFNTAPSYGGTIMTDGNGVSGSTTASVIVTNGLDYYYVVVTNYYGSVTSQIAQAAIALTVLSAGEPIWNQTSQTNVIVTFSDLLDPTTSQTVGNYSLNPSATIFSAALVASNEVALTTSPLSGSFTLTVSNVKDYPLGITMSPSSTNIAVGVYPANLVLWVRADTGVYTNSDGTGNEWDDMSGNNNDFYELQPSTDPLFTINALGDPVIRFTATNDTQLAALSGNLGLTGDMSIIAVANFASLNGLTNGEIVGKIDSASNAKPAPYDYYVQNATTGARLYRGNGSTYGQVTASSVPSIGTPHVLAVSETGSTVSHYLDGAADGTGILNNGFNETNCSDAGQFLYIGARQDGANRLNGDLSELIIAGSPISSYDATELSSDLIQEHHIVLVNTSPTNIVFAASGGNLTLNWPSDHTGWQLQVQTNDLSVGISTNWVDVSGSTTTNQIVVPINLTNGSVFYRLVYPAQ
jgi:hypothetical protein